MKDRQTDVSGQQAHIPVISPLLHWLAMPAVVCLRSSFGYLYLRPKSIFLAFSLCFTLLFIVALNEPLLWRRAGGIIIFGFAVSCLYVIHLGRAVVEQTSNTAEHDTYSGTSHLLRVAQSVGGGSGGRIEMHLHVWIEPLTVALAGALTAFSTGNLLLPGWLVLIAASLSAKEIRNYWSELRKRKRKVDLLEDTGDDAGEQSERPEQEAPKGTRKPRQKHIREGT